MKIIYPALACFLHLVIGGCMDYVSLQEGEVELETISFPPIIDMSHLSPHPSRLLGELSVGKNCKGQAFKVPPIKDRNEGDQLYYLWFFDNKLIRPQSIIEPEFRHTSIITLNIDEQFLSSHFESNLPVDFYERTHLIEFFVSDLPYKIPESRYIDDAAKNEGSHGDYAYWIVSLNKDPC